MQISKVQYFLIGGFFFFISCTPQNDLSLSKTKGIFPSNKAQEMQYHSSGFRISANEMRNWDEIVRKLLNQSPLKRDGDSYRLYAYLYYAQKSFADNSFSITSAYSGSLDYISLLVVNLFYPDYQNDNIKTDLFSKELSEMIFARIKSRYQTEEKQIRSISISVKDGYWEGKNPVGIDYPTMKPWALKDVGEFKSPNPPSPNDPFWKSQLEKTKKQLKNATEQQKQISLFWERMIDPEAADWRFIAVEYMNKSSTPLEMQLEVRSKIMMALIDALIAVFRDKYTYLVRRPFMLDSNMQTLFATPNHPSYPAAHGTLSSAAETVLSYYFPENLKEWNRLGEEARESRLWGGIHFPIDLEAGKKQGQQIGKTVCFTEP